MRHPRETSYHHAEGHPTRPTDTRRMGWSWISKITLSTITILRPFSTLSIIVEEHCGNISSSLYKATLAYVECKGEPVQKRENR